VLIPLSAKRRASTVVHVAAGANRVDFGIGNNQDEKTSRMNNIDKQQVEPRMLNLLRARTLIYRRAKNYQAVGLVISLGLPLIGLVVSVYFAQCKPFIALFALSFSYLEVLFFDPWLKAQLKTAAKLQEDFDCTVLKMDWNSFVAGSKVDPEQVFEDAQSLSEKDEKRLIDWYPLVVRELPLYLARLVCQRTNIWYDSKLRKRYQRVLLSGAVCLGVVVGLISLRIDPTLTSFVLTTLAPITPVVIWALRERNRQGSTCELLDRLNEDIKKLLTQSSSGATEEYLSIRSRELQDAIYNHRVSSPLIFDWVYNRMRRGMEERMNAGAEELVNDLRPAAAKIAVVGKQQ
jgi:hypothetical protein